MVRLKVVIDTGGKCLDYSFNSSMVRLKGFERENINIIELFQFQYGAIKGQLARARSDASISSFNSSMVRLKDPEYIYRITTIKFQFQYGAIKGGHKSLHSYNPCEFQFQYGAIKGLLHLYDACI